MRAIILLILLVFAVLIASPASAQFVVGAIAATCDVSNTGALRLNSGALELCNGSAWTGVGGGAMPSGMVASFNLAACPSGWTEYTAARGRFVRGIDSTGANDPDGVRVLGSTQVDSLQGHNHSVSGGAFYGPSGGTPGIGSGGNLGNDGARTIGAPTTDGTNGTPRTANETRPKNVALLYCQKN